MKKTIEIDSFNPYDSIFPNRKVVSRDILILIKTLRSDGYTVIINPNDDKPVEYIFKKGISHFLSDPLNSLIVTVFTSIAATLVSNYFQKIIDKGKESEKKNDNIIIVDNSANTIINSFNKKIAKKQISEKRKERKLISDNFKRCLKTKSPIPGLPWPILLNHQPKIIGWCRLKSTNVAIEIDKGIITNKAVYRKMKEGKYKGGSITGIAKVSTCNICNSNYVNCNHIAGKKYNKEICYNKIIEADLIEVSVVKEPINTATFIKML
jgi:hypothetical protein